MFTLNFDAGANVAFNLTEEQTAKLAEHPEVVRHIWTIGLKNILQDCHAGVVRGDFKTEEEWISAKRAKAGMKLGALMNGDCRVSRKTSTPKVDDFTNFARKHVLALLPTERRKAMAEMPDKGAATLDAIFAKNEAKLRPIVQAALDAAIASAKAKDELANELDLTV